MHRSGGSCLLTLLAVASAACGQDIAVTPNAGSSFGQFEVRATSAALEGLGDAVEVKVGGVSAYAIAREDARTIRFTVQGAPEPGEKEILISSPSGEAISGTLRYDPPLDARFSRMVAFGASLTMGNQSGSISLRSQLHGPAAQLARALGAYLSLPLVKEGYTPNLTYGDFDKTTCTIIGGDLVSVLTDRFFDGLIPKVTDRNGDIRVDRARVDPALEARNVAIGGQRITQVVHGRGGLIGTVFAHYIWDPFVPPDKLLEEPSATMLDRVIAMHPTIVVSTDLFVNDFNVNVDGDGIPDPASDITPLAEFEESLDTVLARIGETGAELFLATSPDVTVEWVFQDKVRALQSKGYSEADTTGWIEQMRARIRLFNDKLRERQGAHSHLHIVDLAALADDALKNGRDVGAKHLSPAAFGGLLSLDRVHFSDTGYAILAQEYLDAINRALGTNVPPIDLESVLQDDPYSVEHLREAGFDCAGRELGP